MADGDDSGWKGSGKIRNARGQYASLRDYKTVSQDEAGANQGNQQFVTNRYEVQGASLNMASAEHWMSQPWIYHAVKKQTDTWQAAANRMATVPGTFYGQIIYWGNSVSSGGWVSQDEMPELGPVGVVYCENYPSVIDDRLNSTLLKVSNMLADLNGSQYSSEVDEWDAGSDDSWGDYGPPGFSGAGNEW